MRSSGDGGKSAPIQVCVVHHPLGRWEVVSLTGRSGIPCETLEDARRIAYLSVAHGGDCELIVRDAYHRVVEHGLIRGNSAAGDGDGADGSPASSRRQTVSRRR